MRKKVPPVTSNHAPKRNSYRYLEKTVSDAWVDMIERFFDDFGQPVVARCKNGGG